MKLFLLPAGPTGSIDARVSLIEIRIPAATGWLVLGHLGLGCRVSDLGNKPFDANGAFLREVFSVVPLLFVVIISRQDVPELRDVIMIARVAFDR